MDQRTTNCPRESSWADGAYDLLTAVRGGQERCLGGAHSVEP
ncbi:hypothetical protein [Streptomyces sp. A1547]|nr:hypothetical protein [Streptomyces sp. A1547]